MLVIPFWNSFCIILVCTYAKQKRLDCKESTRPIRNSSYLTAYVTEKFDMWLRPRVSNIEKYIDKLQFHKFYIKTHGSELKGKEKTACLCTFRPIWSLQWVTYMYSSSKIIKYCNYPTIYSGYCLVITDLACSNSTTLRWNRLTQLLLWTSCVIHNFGPFLPTEANAQLLHVLWIYHIQY